MSIPNWIAVVNIVMGGICLLYAIILADRRKLSRLAYVFVALFCIPAIVLYLYLLIFDPAISIVTATFGRAAVSMLLVGIIILEIVGDGPWTRLP